MEEVERRVSLVVREASGGGEERSVSGGFGAQSRCDAGVTNDTVLELVERVKALRIASEMM